MNKRRRLLIVDDESSLRELMVRDACNHDIYAVGVGKGLEAVTIYIQAIRDLIPFDGVLLDISVPEMPGTGIARTIRVIENNVPSSTHRTKIGFISAFMNTFLSTSTIDEVGASLLLQKPDDVLGIGQKLAGWLVVPKTNAELIDDVKQDIQILKQFHVEDDAAVANC